MKESNYSGNIFLLPGSSAFERQAVAVTTNGCIKKDGRAVMGAGIAKYVRDHFGSVRDSEWAMDRILGRFLMEHGNHACVLSEERILDTDRTFFLFTFPTKEHWKENSKPDLIRRSCKEITKLADEYHIDIVYLPPPGCNNGHLDYWKDVRPILEKELDDRFLVCIPRTINQQPKPT